MTKLLLIDDEESTRELLKISLESEGYEVYTAEDGPMGLKIFAEQSPPIVVTDIEMPEMDGIEILRRVKRENQADLVVMLHPDHQYDAKVIPQLICPILAGEASAVFGSRMLGGHPLDGGMPWWKYVANVLLTAFANIIFRRFLTEIHSGFRAYSRKYLETVRFMENSDDFIFDTEIIAQGMMCNLTFQEVPITTRYFPEASSINLRRSIVYGFGILGVLLKFWLHRSGWIRFQQFEPK